MSDPEQPDDDWRPPPTDDDFEPSAEDIEDMHQRYLEDPDRYEDYEPSAEDFERMLEYEAEQEELRQWQRLFQLGQRMKARRKHLELSVPRAAKRGDVAATTWRTLEQGYRIVSMGERVPPSNPSDDTLEGIARALDVPVAEVFQWADRKYSPPSHNPLPAVAAKSGDVSQVLAILQEIRADVADQARRLAEIEERLGEQ